MHIKMLMISEEISLLSGQQQLRQTCVVLYSKSQCAVSESCSSHLTFLQHIFPLYFIQLSLPVVSFCKFLWLIRFLGGSFCSQTSFPGWMRLCLNQWGLMASENKLDESEASSQFQMAGKDNPRSDFSPSAVSSQWVWRDHFQFVSVLCQLHLYKPSPGAFRFSNFCYPFQRET